MDTFSVLPDDIIFHILSFLPTKSSGRTCVLAKSWRFRWANVPGVGFACCKETAEEIGNTFCICAGTNDDEFESWIVNVFERNARTLDIAVPLNYKFKLPRRMFACETLVYLRIVNCDGIPMDSTIHYPSLKKLELVNVGCYSGDSLPYLLSGCPVLEELTVEGMKGVYCNISSPTLTRLSIDIDKAILAELECPALRYLRLRVRESLSLYGPAPAFLVEADIDIRSAVLLYPLTSMHCVGKLCNVKCLTLSSPTMEVPSYFFEHWVKLPNLTELVLRSDWRFISSILRNADKLRVLTIHNKVDHDSRGWEEPKQVPECLRSRLEKVKIVDFGWSTEREFDIVKYILGNAQVFKRMKVVYTQHYQLDSNAKFKALERVSMFETRSQACRVTFH